MANTGPTATGGNPYAAVNGTFYWDNASYDATSAASKCDVGYLLNGASSGCAPSNLSNPPFPGTNLSFLAANAGGTKDVTNFSFTSAQPVTATFRASITGFNGFAAPGDEFGWYDTTNTAVLHPVFNSSLPITTTAVTFTPSAAWGVYVKNGAGAIYQSGDNGQQFAVFAQTPASPGTLPLNLTRYWIGVEDLKNTSFGYANLGGDYDYNDLLVEFGVAVPEPSYILLLLLGLAGLTFICRRLKAI